MEKPTGQLKSHGHKQTHRLGDLNGERPNKKSLVNRELRENTQRADSILAQKIKNLFFLQNVEKKIRVMSLINIPIIHSGFKHNTPKKYWNGTFYIKDR